MNPQTTTTPNNLPAGSIFRTALDAIGVIRQVSPGGARYIEWTGTDVITYLPTTETAFTPTDILWTPEPDHSQARPITATIATINRLGIGTWKPTVQPGRFTGGNADKWRNGHYH